MSELAVGKAYDVSLLLGQEDIIYPGDRPYSREVVSSVESGADYNLSDLAMSAHSGTHLDFPAHLIGAEGMAFHHAARGLPSVVDAELQGHTDFQLDGRAHYAAVGADQQRLANFKKLRLRLQAGDG